MDTADFASALEAAHLSKSLLLARLRADSPIAVGECLFCETPLPRPHRWCDNQCRDEWQADEKRMMM